MSVSFPKGSFVISAVRDKLRVMAKAKNIGIDDDVLKKLAEIFEKYTHDADLDALQNEATKESKAREIFARIKRDLENLA